MASGAGDSSDPWPIPGERHGCFLGLFQAPNNSCIMGNVPKNMLGIATGISQLVKNPGMVLGITLSVAGFQYGMKTSTGLTSADAFVPSAATVYYLAAGLSIVGALFSVNSGPSKPMAVKSK